MAQSVDPTQPSQPGASSGHRSRSSDEDSVRAPHQGQQSTRTAPTGRTHDCKRPLRCTPNDLLPGGGHPHMKRREFITLLGGAAAWPLVARAQYQTKIPRIGIIDDSPRWKAFRHELRDLGYLEGQNIAFDYAYADGVPERLAEAAAALVRRPVDVIATFGTPASFAAKQATATIPIVMISIGDPVRAGLVPSLARPGGNITGNTSLGPDVGAKRLQILKEVIPTVSRVALLWNPDNASSVLQFEEVRAAAPTLGVMVISVSVSPRIEIETAFAAMMNEIGRASCRERV